LAKAAAQDDQEDRAAPPLAVSLRVIDVPAPALATVDSANETVIDVLDAIPEGSSVSFSADQLALLLSAGEAIRPASEAHARLSVLRGRAAAPFYFGTKQAFSSRMGLPSTPRKFPWHFSGSVDRVRNWRSLRWRNCIMDERRCDRRHRIGSGTYTGATASRGVRQTVGSHVQRTAPSAADPVRSF
jgi:hypothetical protein